MQYKPLLDEAIKLASVKPETCIMLQRPQHRCELTSGRDHDWAKLRRAALDAGKAAPCVPVLATDPLYILYTSGTTGIPKGVVRDNGGHLVAREMVDVQSLRRQARRDLVVRLRHRLGGRPQLHRLRPAVSWRDLDHV